MRPVPLPPNTFPHFYRGGAAIAEFRGRPVEGPNTPEDWVGSTTTRYGEAELGLSRFTDGTLLRDAIAADPVAWLGPEHAAALGTDPGLLVKLLDAGQRLVVHAHPDRAFAGDHLGCRHGKTEAWIVLSADPGAVVYVGFRADVAAGTVRRWVAEQDTGAMLDALNVLPVRAGDAILVPAGVPHAIGAGVFVVELQEPTDFSVLLEWDGFDVDPDAGHLGLGHEVALGCVDRSAWDPSRLARLRGSGIRGSGDGLLPAEADAFFRAELVRGGTVGDPSFAVLVVTAGSGRVGDVPVRRGDTLVVPYAAGAVPLAGDVTAIRCLPPRPLTGGPARPPL